MDSIPKRSGIAFWNCCRKALLILTKKNCRIVRCVFRFGNHPRKIFLHCEKEVPYACQVEIETYQEGDNITHIRALIVVERDSQRGIIIGKKGEMLKRIGREARLEIEQFIGQKVFLETYVKVDKDWRASEQKLKRYGY